VRTFKTLCELADFSAEPPAVSVGGGKQAGGKGKPEVALDNNNIRHGPAININIQLQLQATEDAKVYDNLSAAMKKHLFPSE
jgi:hypothetical protein